MRRWLKRIAAVVTALVIVSVCLDAKGATLSLGSRGERVALIQQRLKEWGDYTGAVDGVYGRGTYNAVVRFQRRNGLTADGRIGYKTAAALGVPLTGTITATLYRESELSILARLVSGEARGEPYIGQVAVAAVVLNRVRSDEFPDTVSAVIFQPGAFDAVSDGQIDKGPNDTALRAARDAMNGYDPTYGCLYYYNPANTTNKWMLSKPVALRIGNHVFCY